jgi:hypothetical protein
MQIRCKGNKINIIALYRAPAGNFDYFLNKLDHILNSLSKYNTEFIICDDINVNYLENNSRKVQLDDVLRMYNLKSTVYFPTRTTKNSAMLIDNIFINSSRNYNIKQCVNGLSNHDAQLIAISNPTVTRGTQKRFHKREINKNSIAEFQSTTWMCFRNIQNSMQSVQDIRLILITVYQNLNLN